MKRMHVYISGRVQGVFFRAGTQRTARDLGLTGWVRNKADGSVEAVFEGDHANVEKMLQWCREGPPGAAVRGFDAAEEPYTGEFGDFRIVFKESSL
ncbi:MAG: acylphosphatase [Deltaproteobacteria bacterium]|nr:acylphosphatase [Deltaproteobacteria bacterium]